MGNKQVKVAYNSKTIGSYTLMGINIKTRMQLIKNKHSEYNDQQCFQQAIASIIFGQNIK